MQNISYWVVIVGLAGGLLVMATLWSILVGTLMVWVINLLRYLVQQLIWVFGRQEVKLNEVELCRLKKFISSSSYEYNLRDILKARNIKWKKASFDKVTLKLFII